jgi:hypothetical protein
MTTQLTLWLLALITGFFVLDAFWLHWDAAKFLALRLIALIDVLAIWR